MIRVSMQYFGQGSSGKRGSGAKKSGGSAPPASQPQSGMERIQNMSDDEFDNYLNSLSNQYGYPALKGKGYYLRNGTQAVVADLGLNDKPTVVQKGQVNQIAKQNGTPVMYRGVTGNTKANMTSEDIAKQMMYDPLNRLGGGYYGDGFYFSNRKITAQSYAVGGTVVKATLSPNAKVIDYNTVATEVFNYKATHRNSNINFASLGRSSQWGNVGESIMALRKGYNVIRMPVTGGENFYIVIDRSALVVEEV